jgi:2-dehydro-3-deoxygluconokinase
MPPSGLCVEDQSSLVVCFGEAMLRQSQNERGESKITPGGAEYNVACALANLGNSVKWVTSLPTDESADLITQPAIKNGVKLTIIASEHPVGEYRVITEDKTVQYNRGHSAFSHLKSGDIEWRQEISGARWLVTSGITPLLGDGPRANWATAMTFAELDGTLVALDLNHREALGTFEELWNEVEPRLRQVHLLVLSPENLLTLTGQSSPEMLVALRAKWNLPYIACTWKEEVQGVQNRWSAVAHSRGISTTQEKSVLHTPVEPLGGGDAWLAGFIDGLLMGHNPDDCCRRGDILAALTQRTFGDLGNVARDELSRWESIEGPVDLLQDG